ncbi:hypothetical protein NPIL_537471 [Nephila pilipes]|uniref:Uncharacterized protein n=1 Tax=Nephila pilipes TaxID=299642 RepID=A0A8X6PH63_NEPPI|nr:hypothetical protein NPIL_537471 [Nephila pilipes]
MARSSDEDDTRAGTTTKRTTRETQQRAHYQKPSTPSEGYAAVQSLRVTRGASPVVTTDSDGQRAEENKKMTHFHF